MSDQEQIQAQPKSNVIPANFSDADAAMSRRIILGFLVLAGGLLVLMAIPRLRELFS